jgi:hypothetical protein
MSRKIFFLIQFTKTRGYAGSRTYTEELKKVIGLWGYTPVCIGVGTDRTKIVPPYDMYADVLSILELSKNHRCCIVYGDYVNWQPIITQLGKSGRCPLIIHDPAEMGTYLRDYGSQIITLRKTNQLSLHDLDVDSVLLKMPHSYTIHNDKQKNGRILSIQRIDARKKQHLLFKMIHDYNTPIDVYGSMTNDSRPYVFRILDKDYQYWREYYKGEYNGKDKIDYISQYDYYIDLTYCKNHGGFQYTNLECFAASTPIIINKKFYNQDIGKDNVHLDNCYAISDVKELNDIQIDSAQHKHITQNGRDLAHDHLYTSVADEYKKVLL